MGNVPPRSGSAEGLESEFNDQPQRLCRQAMPPEGFANPIADFRAIMRLCRMNSYAARKSIRRLVYDRENESFIVSPLFAYLFYKLPRRIRRIGMRNEGVVCDLFCRGKTLNLRDISVFQGSHADQIGFQHPFLHVTRRYSAVLQSSVDRPSVAGLPLERKLYFKCALVTDGQ